MNEFELKFEVSPTSLKSIKSKLLHAKATKQRMRAHYFDTADFRLAEHGISIRVRLEDKQWVQTAKGKTNRISERLEDNVVLKEQPENRVPDFNLALHAGTPVGMAIAKILNLYGNLKLNTKANETYPELIQIYATDVQRTAMLVEETDCIVEIALDQGRVFTDLESIDLCELEIELKQGAPAAALALARQWCADYRLWLNALTKSMKGQRLIADSGTSPVIVTAIQPVFQRNASGAKMMSAVLQTCLQHILFNASEIASGSVETEHVHQLRVGIRRMRTALRELNGLIDNIDPEWEIVLADVFEQLGQYRDHSQLELVLQPQLEAAGAPAVALAFGAADTNAAGLVSVVRAPALQDVLLAIMGVALEADESRPHAKRSAKNEIVEMLEKRLQKLRSDALKDGRKFLELSGEHQHRVRKRFKRLRYLSEFSAPFFSTHKVKKFVGALKPAQDALGLYNDEALALQACRKQALADEKALFGVGWLSARRVSNAEACLTEILAFAKMRPFWDKT